MKLLAESINNIKHFPFPVALRLSENLGRLFLTFLNLVFSTPDRVALLGRGFCPSQGLYLYRVAQHRKTMANIHALNGIQTHGQQARLTPRRQKQTVLLLIL
jgi:hypothetical protein